MLFCSVDLYNSLMKKFPNDYWDMFPVNKNKQGDDPSNNYWDKLPDPSNNYWDKLPVNIIDLYECCFI